MSKMNPVMFQRIQSAFPDAQVGLVLGDEVAVILIRGHMRTIYKPDPELLEKDFDEELMQQVLNEIWQAHTNVDVFYEYRPEDYQDGTHRI